MPLCFSPLARYIINCLPMAAAIACAIPAAAAERSLETVVVTATRQAQRANELLADVSVIEREEIAQAGAASLDQLLSRQPGLQFSPSGGAGSTTNVFVRGTEGGHVLVLVDGVRVGSATSGNVSWGRIPLAQVERIEILRGPASALYGSDAIGGVIQIFTRRDAEGMQTNIEAGVGSYGSYSVAAGVTGGAQGWRYAVSGARYATDGFNNLRNPGNRAFNGDRDGFANDSLSANLSYSPGKGQEVGISLLHGDGVNKYDSGTTSAAAARNYENQTTVQSYSLHGKTMFGERWRSSLRLGEATDDSTNYTNGVASSIFRTDQKQVSWQNDVSLPLGSAMLGWESTKQRVSGTTAYALKERSIRSVLAGWTANRDAHRVQFNLRRDENSQFGARSTGMAAYGYQFDPLWRASVSYGTAFRAPTFNDLYFPLSFGMVGNPLLQPESSRNRELTLHREAVASLFSATWYRNDVQNLISWSGLLSPVNIGKAKIEGLTLGYAGVLQGFDLGGSLDLLSAKDALSGKRLARRANERLNLSLGRSGGALEWRAELLLNGARYDDNANTKRLGGYATIGLYAATPLSKGWSVFGRIDNAFAKRYELVGDFATPGASLFVGVRHQSK